MSQDEWTWVIFVGIPLIIGVVFILACVFRVVFDRGVENAQRDRRDVETVLEMVEDGVGTPDYRREQLPGTLTVLELMKK